MGSLFDELKKSKLIDDKRAKQIAHEQRVDRKRSGGDVAKDQEQTEKKAEYDRRKAEERRQHREQARRQQAAQREKEKHAELLQLVASRALGDESAGPKRWHFVARDGTVPFLPVNESTARRLQGGELAIIADPNVAWPRYVIVPRAVAERLRKVDDGAVRYLA